jgi:hypothetical protein
LIFGISPRSGQDHESPIRQHKDNENDGENGNTWKKSMKERGLKD